MRNVALLLLPALILSLFAFTPKPCHSEQYRIAKRKLDRLILTSSQREAIRTFEQRFQRQWSHTHSTKGCSHHESHANEFIAAAAGVLNDGEFKRFQSRERTRFEKLGHAAWQSTKYARDLKKLAKSL